MHPRRLLAPRLAVVLLVSSLAAQQPEAPPFAPRDISGTYHFLRKGEFVHINIIEFVRDEDDPAAGSEYRVTGFLSRLGDSPSNSGAVLDHFMARGELRGNQLTFTTRSVHGVKFEFSGVVERGKAAERTQEGYFVLRGKLTRYTEDAAGQTTQSSREVALLSLPSDADGDDSHSR